MTDNAEPKRHTPDKLLGNFTKSRFWTCVAIAVGAHLVLMLVTSVTYIRVEWFGAEPPVQKTQEEAVVEKPVAADTAAPAPEEPPEAESKAAAPGDVYELMGGRDGAEALRQAKDTEVVREITEVAKPEEIPTIPDDLGISIQDTNPR